MENLPNNELPLAFSAPSTLNRTVYMAWSGWMKEKVGNPLANGAISKQKAEDDLSRWSILFMFHTVLWNRNQDNCFHLPGLRCWVVICAAYIFLWYMSCRPKLTFFPGQGRATYFPLSFSPCHFAGCLGGLVFAEVVFDMDTFALALCSHRT